MQKTYKSRNNVPDSIYDYKLTGTFFKTQKKNITRILKIDK